MVIGQDSRVRAFRAAVWRYFRMARRDFPWRRTRNPYRILVSEVMLQQTQVVRVVEKYAEFLKRFPTCATLARADSADVLRVWQGLGYNRRALYLKRAAEQIIAIHGGRVPRTLDALMALPGVGRYTAGAVLAFAYNIPAVCVETNIRRTFLHYFFRDRGDVSDVQIIPLVERALDRGRPREWYWALMDYGAMLGEKLRNENPNRRSRHYVAQSKFEGSNRQIRGNMLKEVLKLKQVAISKFKYPPERLRKVLSGLERDGFIERHRGGVKIKQ